MAVTAYDAQFGSKQDTIARLGKNYQTGKKKMTEDEHNRFMNSPMMKQQEYWQGICREKASARDKQRMKTDKSFKPKESDWTQKPAHEFDVEIDYYRVLGADEYETQEGIKKAYRRLSLVYHPDKASGLDTVTAAEHGEIFIQINNAYLVLGDNPTRRQYDKKRDDKVVADELWGAKKMKEAKSQFDAFKLLEELTARKPKPSNTVQVPVKVKLEKMLYGGLKKVTKERRVETVEGFEKEMKTHEVCVPSCCSENFPVMRKRVGDHHKENKPDNLEFGLRSKTHAVVRREGENIVMKRPVKLKDGAVQDPYTSVDVASVGGRAVFLFGRNPFYKIHNNGACHLRVSVRGEAFGPDGNLRFEVDYPRAKPDLARPEWQPLLERVDAESSCQLPSVAPAMRRRRERSQGLPLECFVDLSQIREPLHLGTSPPSSLHFYGNRTQPLVTNGREQKKGVVPPKLFFAIVLRCPMGAKKLFRQDWERLRKVMAPLLWPSFWMLIPAIRSIQPKPLDNAPAYEYEELELEKEKEEEGETCGSETVKRGAESSDFFLPQEQQEYAELPPVVRFLLQYGLGPPGGFGDTDGESVSVEEDQVRPAWANARPEPVGIPEARGPQLPECEEASFPAKISKRYRGWPLYPRIMQRPPRPRLTATKTEDGPPVPWMRLGDRAFARRDFWLAHSFFASAAPLPPENPASDFGEGHETCDGDVFENVDHGGRCQAGGSQSSTASPAPALAAFAAARRADCLRELGLFHAALAEARQAAKLAPASGGAWRRVGVVAARVGEAREAEIALRKAVELEPSHQDNVILLQKLKPTHAGDASVVARAEKISGTAAIEKDEAPGKAIAHYTAALAAMRVLPDGSVPEGVEEEDARLLAEIFSNRSAAFAQLALWAAAERDARRIFALPGQQNWAKGHTRLGMVLLATGKHEEAYPHFAQAIKSLPASAPSRNPATIGREACLRLVGLWSAPAARLRRARFHRDAGRSRETTRVHAVSDIHFDQPRADEWIHKISTTKFLDDVLIVAGGVATNLFKLKEGLQHLRAKFRRVFFIPGNHDLWIHTSEEKDIVDSLHKLFLVVALCDEVDVDVFPASICRGLTVVPLFSWYSPEFDEDDPFPSTKFIFDKFATWPMDRDNDVWRYMLYLNHRSLEMCAGGDVITFSHFLPRKDLPFWSHVPGLVKAMGCPEIDEQVRQVGSCCHIYGHSNIKSDKSCGGVRYIQNSLGNTKERQHPAREPFWCVFNGRRGGLGLWPFQIDE